MPTPLEILLDPVSLILIAIFISLIIIEKLFSAQQQKRIKHWVPKTLLFFISYFYLSTYLPLIWDKYLLPYQLINLQDINPVISTVIAVLIFEILIYFWHRALHRNQFLWRTFHQLHHSAERVDALGAFYFSPLDMAGFTFLGSLSLTLFVGISPQGITWYLYLTMLLTIFPHTNIKTPCWLGYIIQRPESHSVHHQKGVHAYNYSDLPIFDILFGTFKNPKSFSNEFGFFNGSSYKTKEMLLGIDLSQNKHNSF